MKQLSDDYCGPGCRGLCPCPNPPWEWRSNQVPKEKKVRNPQLKWNSALKKKYCADANYHLRLQQ
tara:strand:- start:423 stop:617 length:195 start_codon:yes stop_codon:yes gene_type:complete